LQQILPNLQQQIATISLCKTQTILNVSRSHFLECKKIILKDIKTPLLKIPIGIVLTSDRISEYQLNFI
jgi:hypothetical protein